jgi:hypothetical protein
MLHVPSRLYHTPVPFRVQTQQSMCHWPQTDLIQAIYDVMADQETRLQHVTFEQEGILGRHESMWIDRIYWLYL